MTHGIQDFKNFKTFEELTEADGKLLQELFPIIAQDKELIVDALYQYLSQFDELKELLRNLEKLSGGQYKQVLIRWVLGLFAGTYDQQYYIARDVAVNKYLEAKVPLKIMLLTFGYIRNLVGYYLYKNVGHIDANKVMRANMALNKLIDLDIMLTTKAYYSQKDSSSLFTSLFGKKQQAKFE